MPRHESDLVSRTGAGVRPDPPWTPATSVGVLDGSPRFCDNGRDLSAEASGIGGSGHFAATGTRLSAGARYPPDKQEKTTITVLQQAELLCAGWAEG